MDKTAIVPTNESRIAPWGERKELREIARRVQLMAPGGKRLDENEALALAQGAIAHGLDPFNGEIWYIPGSGLMAGIKGLRKAARQQIDGSFWTEFLEITDPDERNLFMIPDKALAFKCIIRDSETIRTYSDGWKRLKEDGVPVEIIPEVLGKRPYSTGVGYIKDGESTRMDPIQVAMKRSEADALKRRFDLPFAVPSEPTGPIIAGEWTLEEDPENGSNGEEEATEATETLFGSEDGKEEETAEDTSALDMLKEARDLATKKPYEIGSTQFWLIANHFGVDTDEGQAIKKELSTWADSLIFIINKYGPLDGLAPESSIDATDGAIEFAGKHDIQLRAIQGTGKEGRILLKDVEAAAEAMAMAKAMGKAD
ncbi:hypothetical protein LCGC14_0401300 [marine sediment metagenome]|uniref:Peripheral subunit-binding (PSBD) domain-containing protein n=1 Tax=marine sediment metagenome TaxID=412755 RepID=A0A0F9TF10_9ZZZZ